jgi:fructose-1,6-bisphosphatase/inositol monophosphatase family enzyme
MNYGDILQTATAIAHETGDVVRDRFPRTRLTHVGFKGAVNPVTEADTAVEALIVARLRAAFPSHRFLGVLSPFRSFS